jgi:pimeloyl-ACP methyl ester carboxylesterase
MTSQSSTATGYAAAPNRLIQAPNGLEYAYRDVGAGEPALLLFQHFRGNLDNWDPFLIDGLASSRRVVTFDNAGVGGSTGATPHTIREMAVDALAFVEALELERVDLLGYSIGSFVAQEVALIRPDLINRIVLASSAPQGAPGMHGWHRQVIEAVGRPGTNPEGYLGVFYTDSPESSAAGKQSLGRMFARTEDRDEQVTWETRLAQYDAVCAWGIPNHSALERVTTIESPVLVANGDSDPMVLPRYSYLLAGLLPDARVQIYEDAGHGFLFQHHGEFSADVDAFLS